MEPSPLGVAELPPGLGEPAREECGGSTQMTHPESKCKLTVSHPYVCTVQDPSAQGRGFNLISRKRDQGKEEYNLVFILLITP